MAGRRLPPLPTVKDILRIYRINAVKNLSQNFIMDPRLLDKFARAAGDLAGRTVVEVGPGPGGITRAILGQGANRCAVIEKDPRFLPALKLLDQASGGRMEIHLGDALEFPMLVTAAGVAARPWHEARPDLTLMGNLPFNVSTPLLIRWLNDIAGRSGLWSLGRVPATLTFQLEVGQRLSAPPGHPARSRLSVVAQNWTAVHHNFNIPGQAFVPAPEVDVAVITLNPLKVPYIDLPFATFNKVVTTVFQGKRKGLEKTVANLFPPPLAQPLAHRVLDSVGLPNPRTRPIDLDMAAWGRLCHCYTSILAESPSLGKFLPRGRRDWQPLQFSPAPVLQPAQLDSLDCSGTV